MASRSLGTLTLDLLARIGGFESGMDRAARIAARRGRDISESQRRAARQTEQAWSKVGEVIGAAFAGITVGVVFQKFIAETVQAEKEQAQLAAVLKSTGNAAGYSQGKLNEMADAMQGTLGIAAGDINQAQTVLLAFTNIVGDKLPAALQAASDHSARTGTEIKASAEIMGRALDVPSVGMASLQKQGFKFSESQIEVAREMERTGRIAEAQQMVLDSLNESYGGAAIAARDTLGGAYKALQNTINDLLTGDSGSMKQLKSSLEAMNSAMADEGTRAAFQTLIGWMTELSTSVIRGTANLVAFINTKNKLSMIMGTDEFGTMKGNAEAYSHQLTELVSKAERFQEALNRNPQDANMQRMLENVRKKITEVQRKSADASQSLKDFAELAAPKASTDSAPDMTPRSPGNVNIKDGAKGGGKAKAVKVDNDHAARSYIQHLNDQIGKLNELTSVEKVLYDLQLGKIKLTHDQKDIALGLAQEIDAQKALTEQKKSDLELTITRIQAQRDFNTEMERYARQINGMGMGNAAREKSAGVAQINDKYSDEYKRLEDRKRQAIYDDKWTAAAEQRYDDELKMLQGYQSMALSAYEDYYAQIKAKEGDMWLGSSEAMANYVSESSNVFAQTESAMTKAFQGMEDALVSFVMTGKLDFKSLANSIIADIIRMQIKAAAVSFLSSMFGTKQLGSSGVTVGGVDAMNGYASGGYTGTGGKYDPAGIVHAGEFVINADSTKKLGLPYLNKLNGYADGGYVGNVPAMARGAARAASGGGQGANIVINNTIGNVASQTDVVSGMKAVRSQIMQELARGSRYGSAMI